MSILLIGNNFYLMMTKLHYNNYVYACTSGIDTSHPDFGGRAKFGVSFIEEYDEDLRGHGTSVAGIIIIIIERSRIRVV